MGERETIQDQKVPLQYVSQDETERILKADIDRFARTAILSDVFRLNTLYMIMNAGSGHIGTSFSAMDLAAWLWCEELTHPNEDGEKESDIYFSSKGHDAPGLYTILIGLGKLEFEQLHKLRRLGGLPGHPDVGTPYIMTNTGSLGMGISKARGMAEARRINGTKGKIYVVTGDGELQEGQIWESLRPTVNGKFGEITVIVDHNKMQSDTWVDLVSDLGDIEERFRSSGWEVARCDGHDMKAIHDVIERFKTITDRPQILIADTIKAKGVSFMESTSFKDKEGYKYHAGAPAPDEYVRAHKELIDKIHMNLKSHGLDPLRTESKELPQKGGAGSPENLLDAYGDELLKVAEEQKKVVVLDADLLPDCGIVPFKKALPDRFFECGIAEQDMVSMAGGMALQGLVPVVHSFACFLTPRPNDQIYNNATEKTKIIYTGTLAGLVPGGPGHSHQSVRDISAMGAMPGLIAVEPANEVEARAVIRWAIEENKESTYIRLVNIPFELPYSFPSSYKLSLGKGTVVREGKDIAFIGYGPVMLKEAIHAAELLLKDTIQAAVINLPWLNRVDQEWLRETLGPYKTVVTLDNHYIAQGQGEFLSAEIARSGLSPKILNIGLQEIPACGTNDEVLEYHKMNASSLRDTVRKEIQNI